MALAFYCEESALVLAGIDGEDRSNFEWSALAQAAPATNCPLRPRGSNRQAPAF